MSKKINNLQLIAFKTIFFKEYLRFMRIWVQTILPPVITMSLYFVIFGTLIGSQIDNISGFTFIEFIVPKKFVFIIFVILSKFNFFSDFGS